MVQATRTVDPHVLHYRHIVLSMVRNEAIFFDLTDRQRAVMLVVYTDYQGGQTVRGLASTLRVERPAITRALNRLNEFNLIERRADPLDGRSILVAKTKAGTSYMRSLRNTLLAAEKQVERELTSVEQGGVSHISDDPGHHRRARQQPGVRG